jgi:phosphoserine phosphatase
MCGEMVAIHAGMRDPDLERAAEEFFASCIEPSIFPEMRHLVERMRARGSDIWAISSTNDWVVRAGVQRFGISANRVLAVAVGIENGSITDRLLRIPSGEGKTEAIREHVRTPVDAAFGNSRWDVEMLEFVRQPYVINPNPDLEELARKRGWPIYFPAKTEARR